MEQNLIDQSATLSRLSIIDKTSDDLTNNTQIKLISSSERLGEEIYKNQKNQILEQQVVTLQLQLKLAIDHITILQDQVESKQKEINQLQLKLQEQINKNENESRINSQNQFKIEQLQMCLKEYAKPSKDKEVQKHQFFYQLKDLSKKYSKPTLTNQKTNQTEDSSKRYQNNQLEITEDSSMKDTSVSDFRSTYNLLNTKQNFNQSGKKFWSPPQFQSPTNQKQSNLKKRLDITITQIKAMQQHFSQYQPTK
ncbi:unnamed protein product (macronuclear) [Paramecium tetraurelia]|uniref:Uncharacterized protein n=1 Tax=Paramecium tetraurelia TaxID=5888 RepID=A0EF99_PARTE|nr:uncharacterized protein GSPATT00026313001 [Paramecium tetraurelia]CAK93990.1 unnamed protein product [Paramecium tetraurelia]|eukprot:XP_001461363.1 hypothetical protein (macronuclear) [Paramecium tetraurelia strain d4-2]